MANLILQQTDPNAFLNFLLLAYFIMWLIAGGYILSLAIQQQNMRRDIDLLKRLLDEATPSKKKEKESIPSRDRKGIDA